VDLYEYQAYELFARHGVPVMPGVVATTPQQAELAATKLGVPVMVKAQVKTGGRGEAGGVKIAHDPAEAATTADGILGMSIHGHTVRSVLVTPATNIDQEFYVSIILDRANRAYLAMASVHGGMGIERLAAEHPDALAQVPIDPLTGLDAAEADRLVQTANFPHHIAPQVADVVLKLWDVVAKEDATLAEINPLAITGDGRLLALDGKVTLDDNARYRHAENFEAYDDQDAGDPLEAVAKSRRLNYVKLDGQVGVIGNGAGLVMSTLDVIADAGERHGGIRPANFLDIGGGASAAVMTDGLSVVLSDPQVMAVLVNVFGGITACDQIAHGILGALDALGHRATKPLVVRLAGNAVDAGRAILRDAHNPLVHMAGTMDEAAELVTVLAEQATHKEV